MAEWYADFADTFYRCFIKEDRYMLLVNGIGVTLKVSLIAVILGVLIGMLIALCNLSNKKLLRFFGGLYTDIIRGTPSVTQLMIIYFVIFASVNLEKWIIAAIAFGINSGAYVAELIRSGIMSIDGGQMEAGRSLGLGYVQSMRYIILPQAFKNILPALANEFIVLIKETAVAGYVGLADLTYAGSIVAGNSYTYFVPMLGVAAIYLIIVMFFTWLVGKLERRLRASER